MKTIYANDCGVLRLGYQSENDRTEVIFDVSDLANEFPGGMVSVAVRRPSESAGHLITSIVQNGPIVTWLVDDYELEKTGVGELQLIYSVPGVVAKTKIWGTETTRSLTVTNSVPPDWMDVVNELLEAAGEVYQVTEQMHTWRDETEGYRNETLAAKDSVDESVAQIDIWHEEVIAAKDSVDESVAQIDIWHDETEGYRDEVLAAKDIVAEDKAQVKIWRDETEEFRDDAEQIAATAGYMEVEIVNGHLIYRRTKNVDIDFALRDGHLYMEVE